MPRTYEIKDVPESEVEEQVNILKQDGATEVTSQQQENGMYTIIAVYPD